MRIAIPYEEGNVFQHFGKSKQFKLYTVENGKIVSSEVISAGDTGHEALAGLLAELDVKAVICGGLGEGMMNALAASGIDVYPGISGEFRKLREPRRRMLRQQVPRKQRLFRRLLRRPSGGRLLRRR